MTKGTKLYSIFRNKCPQCHEGDFFSSSNAYRLSRMTEMPDKCEVCGQSYQPEPGFYYGAMYVSYGLGVAQFVAIWVATSVLFPNMNVWVLISLVVGGQLLVFPPMFRLSRRIWINLFVKYKGNLKHNKQEG